MTQPLIPVAHGELIDKITILEIKSERISDPAKLENVNRELAELLAIWSPFEASNAGVADPRSRLKGVNEALWDIEDDIRLKEAARAFDEEFIRLARAVYVTNDRRAAIKREINEILGSKLVEEKSYEDY
ncbi:MAG: DUF6165 family protein [Pseudomonadota bacterium]